MSTRVCQVHAALMAAVIPPPEKAIPSMMLLALERWVGYNKMTPLSSRTSKVLVRSRKKRQYEEEVPRYLLPIRIAVTVKF